MSDVDVSMGTLYDVNKSAMSNYPKMDRATLKNKLKEVEKYFKKDNTVFHMLLCHERRDYTVFMVRDNKDSGCIEEAISALKDCMVNRGTILEIEQQPDGAYEIWLRIDEEPFCYYLFPYDQGIIIC